MGHRQVAGEAIRPGDPLVSDLPDNRLDKPVLAPLGRPWIAIYPQHFATDERLESFPQLVDGATPQSTQPFEGEGLAEDGGILHYRSQGRIQLIEAGTHQPV